MAGSLNQVVEALRNGGDLGAQVVHAAYLPPEEASLVDPDPPLPVPLQDALARSGVRRLWSHQAEGLAAVRRGENVLITTPTASGKSLVFQLPVLEEALAGGPGRALFLYPLKALGRDQRTKFEELARGAGLTGEEAWAAVYDGDTPRAEREEVKRRLPRVLISNPDMLHMGILGHHGGWAPFLRELRWVVLDELHTYRGIFGSHFHHVLRRFLRVAAAEGAKPVLVASSATAANAGEFAQVLTGRPFTWIQRPGAPREGRHLLLLRSDLSPYTATLKLFTHLLGAGLKTIVFTKARRITELLYSWLRRGQPELARRVASYRSGFLPEERRTIEGRLFSGELDGVISTSALEMGIDVGGLDACILVGYPGSMMATWQRSGRVGRSGRESITALVALPDALDQYFLDHPGELLERPCERLVVDPDNEPVARAHLVCAAAEKPLSRSADRDYLDRFGPVVDDLLQESHLVEAADGGEIFAPRRLPHRHVSLRGTGETFTILREGSGRAVGTVDGVRVLHECHPGAVYLHWGRQFLVRDLDLAAKKVHAEPVRLDYFTTPLVEKETEILEVLAERTEGPLAGRLGRLRVTERVVGYERKRLGSQEVLGQHSLDLPPMRFTTVGLWWPAPREVEETVRLAGGHFLGSLHAAEHAAISLFPLLALCDRGDIGGISFPLHPQVEAGAVFVYDGHPGGVGIATRVFDDLPGLLARVLALLDECPCQEGCPSCIQSPKCGNGNRPLDKAGAARVLRLLLGREEVPEEARAAAARPRVGVRASAVRQPRMGRVRPAESESEGEAEGPAGREGPANRPAPGVLPPGPVIGGPGEGEAMAAGPSGAPPAPSQPASLATPSDAVPVPPAESGAAGPTTPRATATAGPTGTGAPSSAPATVPGPSSSAGAPGGQSAGPVLPAVVEEPAVQLWPPRRALPRRPQRPRNTVLFDIETKRAASEVGGWGNAHKMGVAVAVACLLEEGRFEVFEEDRVCDLVDFLRSGDLVVGFNVRRFDYQVLAGYTGEDYNRTLPTLDLLEDVHHRLGLRLGLAHLARETLQADKTADGLKSLEWVRQGRLDLVTDYCRRDVELLRDLYLFGRREGHLFYRNREKRRLRFPVDW